MVFQKHLHVLGYTVLDTKNDFEKRTAQATGKNVSAERFHVFCQSFDGEGEDVINHRCPKTKGRPRVGRRKGQSFYCILAAVKRIFTFRFRPSTRFIIEPSQNETCNVIICMATHVLKIVYRVIVGHHLRHFDAQ